MAIAYVDSDVFYAGAQNFDSAAFDLGSASGRAVVAFVTCGDAYTVTGMRIGASGTVLTEVATGLFGTGAYARRYIFAGIVTETGSQVVSVTTSAGGGTRYGYAASYSGVDSVRGGTSDGNNADPNANPSLGVTTVNGDTVVMIGHDGERATSFTTSTGGTPRVSSGSFVQDQATTTTGTTTTAGTLSTPGFWQAGAVALVPSGGGGGSSAGAAAHYYRQQG